MRIRHFIACALLALLAACGPPQPQYQTDIEFIPPASDMGRMCANNCLLAQQNCQQSCGMQEQNCRHIAALEARDARHQADRDYENYVEDRTRQGKLIKKERSDFRGYYDSGSSCSTDGCELQCVNSFHMCYSNCGGQVIPHTYCVANCGLVPAAPMPMAPAPLPGRR